MKCKWSENHLSKTSAQLRVCIALENFHGHTRGEQHKYCKISSWKPFFTSVDPKTSVKLFSCWRPSTNIAVWAGILNLALFIFAIYKCNWEGHKFSHAHVNSFTGKRRVPFSPPQHPKMLLHYTAGWVPTEQLSKPTSMSRPKLWQRLILGIDRLSKY